MAELKIDAVVESDLDSIASIERTSFSAPWSREFFVSELSASGRHNLVARLAEGTIAGYLFSMFFMDEMHINKIAVQKEWRRGGVAFALMQNCLDFAYEQSIELISLEVRESNVSAQSFYEKISFQSTYRRPHYYPDGEAAIVMSRRVG